MTASGWWATGDPAPAPGLYVCLDCEEVGEAYHVLAAAGDLLPRCALCDDASRWRHAAHLPAREAARPRSRPDA